MASDRKNIRVLSIGRLLTNDSPTSDHSHQLYRLAWGFYLILALAGVVWQGLRQGDTVRLAWFVDRDTWALDGVLGVAAALVLIVAWELMRVAASSARGLETYLREVLADADTGELLGLALLSGFSEELFFRGAVMGAWGWLPATLLFALLHAGPGKSFALWTAYAGAAGGLFAALTLWRHNLLAAMLAHVLVNSVNLLRLTRFGSETETTGETQNGARVSARLASPSEPSRSLVRMTDHSEAVLRRVERQQEEHLEVLKEYLRIPSISTDPQYEKDVLRCSDFVVEQMRAAGLTAERIETEGYPLVYGEWLGAPGKPTVLFYGHYDVQPVDPIEEWRNPPFEPQVEGDHLVARGATDDKGQSLTHIKAVEAILKERGELPVNVKFIVEGEEESGGEAIEKFVQADAGERLACDCVLVSDTAMFAPGQPSLLYGLKGLVYMELRVTGPNRDLHSGTFGGAVQNPANALAHIISSLQDPQSGKVLVPGFYDRVRPLEQSERQEWRKLPFDEEAYREELGVTQVFGEEGYSTQERAWARPTCDVNGIYGGYQGEGAKTVLPSWAGAKVSLRLVPDQEPGEIARLFTEHVQAVAPPGVRVEVTEVHGAVPVLIDSTGQLAEAAMKAQEEVWGAPPVRVREGGSIPIVASFAQVLKTPILLVGFGLPDDRLHSPNEKINISHYYNGIRTIVRFLDLAGSA